MAAIQEMLPKTVKNGRGEDVSVSSFTGPGKIVGLYFSAHWCPPCKMFTPVLAKFYKKIKAAGKEFEIVFISEDASKEEFNGYFSEMLWLAVEYSSSEIKFALGEKFDVDGIPTLILLDGETGAVITDDGQSIVERDPEGARYPWKK